MDRRNNPKRPQPVPGPAQGASGRNVSGREDGDKVREGRGRSSDQGSRKGGQRK